MLLVAQVLCLFITFFGSVLTETGAADAIGTDSGTVTPHARILIVAEDQSQLVGPYLDYLEDPDGSLDLLNLLSGEFDQDFIASEQPVPQFKNRHSTYWLKLNLKVMHNNPNWYFYISYPHLKDLTLYAIDKNGQYQAQHLGYGFLANKSIDSPGYAFPLVAHHGSQQTLYLRLNSDSPLILPAYIRSGENLFGNVRLISNVQGLFYGIFIVMSFFNLFIFFTTRDTSYLYYVLYISSISIFTLSNDGILRELLFSNSPILASYDTHMLTAIAPILFGSLFCQHFLNTRETLPNFNKAFQLIITLCVLNIVIIFVLGTNPMPRSVMFLTPLMAFLALASAIAGLKKGIHTARFFLVAWLSLILSSTAWILTLLDILPFNQLSAFLVHAGAAIETILLSMALGDRIKHLEQDRLRIEKESKQILEESNRRLAASNKFKDEFLSTISHELRTPMNGIFGATELLHFTHLTEEQSKYARTITQSSRDMLYMVEDILTYTQSEAGSLQINNELLSPRDLIQSVAAQFKPVAEQKGITFELAFTDALPNFISSDRNKIKILLEHLLDNAVKFTDEGSVRLNVAFTPNANHSKGALEFSITDTGCGIPEDQYELIFQSFKQVDGSMTRRKGGLGIGLALCKSIVEILGAKLTLDSVLGEGTTMGLVVEVTLVDGEEELQVNRAARGPAIFDSDMKILVVEDNYVNKLILESMLQKLGFTVFASINGQEAVEFLQTTMVNLVLMDCQMPVMDGYEATMAIRELKNTNASVPIIAVTANANQGDKYRCLEAGMNDYIKKPISQKIITEKLTTWLSPK